MSDLTQDDHDFLKEELRSGGLTPEQEDIAMDRMEAFTSNQEQPPMNEPEPQGDPRILTTPMPTGVQSIDRAGEPIYTRPPVGAGFRPGSTGIDYSETHAGLNEDGRIENQPFDSQDNLKLSDANSGTDRTTGMPSFGTRAAVAVAPHLQERRAATMQNALQPHFDSLPEGLPKFRYVQELDEFQIMREQPDDPGKFRWTSMDGSGLELEDMADMMDPAELLSLGISILGTGKHKIFTVGLTHALRNKVSGNVAMGAGGFGGGLVGRYAGDAISLYTDYMKTGYVPTPEDFQTLKWDGLKIEAFAAGAGEFGAKILRGFSNAAQDYAAKAQGRQAVIGDADELAIHNSRIEETQADMREVSSVLGREDLPTTPGQAAHSVETIADENFAKAAASKETQRAFNVAEARGKRTTQDYINEVWGGNEKAMGEGFGTIVAANKSLHNASVVVARNERGVLKFANQLDPEGGLTIHPNRSSTHWEVGREPIHSSATKLNEGDVLQTQQMYDAALAEARGYGRGLSSPDSISKADMAQWERMGAEDGTTLVRAEDAVFNKANQRWETATPGTPVMKIEPDASISQTYLDTYVKQAQDPKTGQFIKGTQANDEMTRMLARPSTGELGVITREIENPFVRQQYREALLKDYERAVKDADGNFSAPAFAAWKAEHKTMTDLIFGEEAAARITNAGGIRALTEGARGAAERQIDSLSTIFKVKPEWKGFKDPSSRMIWNQLKSLDRHGRQRAMRVLDIAGQGDAIRGLFKDELRLTLQQKTQGAAVAGYEKWLGPARELIKDVLGDDIGPRYLRSLDVIGNILKRRSDRNMVRGLAPEANPTVLALTRVMFGPLSRAQRFFSAARKGQVRSHAATIGDIITDPDLLKRLTEIKTLPLSSRATARWLQDAGMVEAFWFDEERFDADNPHHRQRIADTIYMNLQTEMQESNDAQGMGSQELSRVLPSRP